jgi:DNA-binding NtrC family response regulator
MPQASQHQRPRLLIASDQRFTSRAIQSVLSRNGYEAFHVENLPDAHHLLHQERFDVFLCQVPMPEGMEMTVMSWAMRELNIATVALIFEEEPEDVTRLASLDAFDARLGPPPFDLRMMLQLLDRTLGAMVCPDCKGKGNILLFTSRPICSKCGGTGRFRTGSAGAISQTRHQ